MENRFIYLNTCNTCKRIQKELHLPESVILQNTKEEPVTEEQVDFLKDQAESYEALFNRRSQQYRGRGLHEQELSEKDYRSLLLDHYSFIKRPILILDGVAFIGNSKKTVAAAAQALGNE